MAGREMGLETGFDPLDSFHEECGVFGVFGSEEASVLTALGLHALQHRGQEAAGIVSYDGQAFHAHRALGHVGDNFGADSPQMAQLGGLDRWLGFLFGLIRGFVIVLVIYASAVVAAEGEDNLPGLVTDAQITPALRESAHLMSGVLPPDMREQLIENLPDASETTEELQEAGEAVSERIEDAASDNNDGSGGGLNLLQDEGGN